MNRSPRSLKKKLLPDVEPKSLQEVFAENVRMFMMIRPKLRSQELLAAKIECGQATISRAMNGVASPSLGLVERIAIAYRVEPWQLLVPGLDPRRFMEDAETPASEQVLQAKLAAIQAVLDEVPAVRLYDAGT